jgi:hypothetical protein
MFTKEQWEKAQSLPIGIPDDTTSKQQSVNTREGVDPYHRFSDDPCRFRHGGNIDSRAAWERVSLQRRETYEKILAFYHDSLNPIAPKDLSGRFTELKEMGILRPVDETFEGSRRLELVSRMKPSPLAELAELGKPSAGQPRKRLPGHDNCVGLCCTTGAFLEDFWKEVEPDADCY